MEPTDAPASLQTLPLELLLEIFSHLLTPLPTHYSYTHAASPVIQLRDAVRDSYNALKSKQRPNPLRTHGILLASRQLGADYTTAFYARTNFFFYIDQANASAKNWFALSPAALPNIRACKVYIEAGRIKHHGVKLDAFIRRVHKLLGAMERLRSVQLVWDIGPIGMPVGYARVHEAASARRRSNVKLDWESLGESFVEELKQRELLKDFIVTVGDRIARFKRVHEGWIERGDGVECGSHVANLFPFL
jgi:hypothetical protein